MSSSADDSISPPKKTLTETLQAIPCFRESFMTGIGCGVLGWVVTFLSTSRARFSSHVGFGTYMGVTLATWCWCNHNYRKSEQEIEAVKLALSQKITMEGTELEKKMIEDMKSA